MTYLVLFLYTLLAPKGGQKSAAPHPRQIITTAMGVTWCSRLGTYLLERVLIHGKDERFDKVKHQPAKFALFWFIQGLWVYLVGSPTYIVNTIPASEQPDLGPQDYLGQAMWAAGFLIEVVSDAQKFHFKLENPDQNMQTGLWARSRHINYFGEVLLWTGNWITCASAFSKKWHYVSALSPIFTYNLLTKLSGVPLLEVAMKKKYGHLESVCSLENARPARFTNLPSPFNSSRNGRPRLQFSGPS